MPEKAKAYGLRGTKPGASKPGSAKPAPNVSNVQYTPGTGTGGRAPYMPKLPLAPTFGDAMPKRMAKGSKKKK